MTPHRGAEADAGQPQPACVGWLVHQVQQRREAAEPAERDEQRVGIHVVEGEVRGRGREVDERREARREAPQGSGEAERSDGADEVQADAHPAVG